MSPSFSPEQYLRRRVLLLAMQWDLIPAQAIEASNVDTLYTQYYAQGLLDDAQEAVRSSGEETSFRPRHISRNYDSREVAAKMDDGQWVAWTYFYNGGKHGNPQGIPWMDDAYFVHCEEKEKVVTVYEFRQL